MGSIEKEMTPFVVKSWVESSLPPHKGGNRCRGTATPVKDAGASEQRCPTPPLQPPRGFAQRCWASGAAGLDPTCATIGPILFSCRVMVRACRTL